MPPPPPSRHVGQAAWSLVVDKYHLRWRANKTAWAEKSVKHGAYILHYLNSRIHPYAGVALGHVNQIQIQNSNFY